MFKKRWMDFGVGSFFILGLSVFFFLSSVTGQSSGERPGAYQLKARFDDVSGLVNRSVVRISGVTVGQVNDIVIVPDTYSAMVTLTIYDPRLRIPADSTIGVYTEGVLGSKYLSIMPGFSDTFLDKGDEILRTNSAVVLENLFSKLLLFMGEK